MKNIFYSALGLFFTMLLSLPRAYSNSNLSNEDQKLYDFTLSKCQSEHPILEQGLFYINSMKSSYSDFNSVLFGLNISTIKRIKSEQGLSPEVAYLLGSEGFYQALIACYPNNENDRHDFAKSIIISDIVGRGVGSIQGIVTTIVSGKIIYSLTTKAYRLFSATRFGSGINPEFEKRNIRIFMSLVASVYTVYIANTQLHSLDQINADKESLEQISLLSNIHSALNKALIKLQINPYACADALQAKSLYIKHYEAAFDFYNLEVLKNNYQQIKNLKIENCNFIEEEK